MGKFETQEAFLDSQLLVGKLLPPETRSSRQHVHLTCAKFLLLDNVPLRLVWQPHVVELDPASGYGILTISLVSLS